MFVKCAKRRLGRPLTVAVTAAVVVGAAACGSSGDHNTAKPGPSSASPTHPAPPPAPPPPPPPPSDYVEGMISSFQGNTIGLRTRQGTATVDFSPSTEIIETTPGQLSDVVPGSCVEVHPAPQSNPGAMTAQSVSVSPAAEGKCPPPPPEPPAGAPPPAGGPAPSPGVDGKVDSVSNNTITVANVTGPPTNVTVTDTTTYSKVTPVDTDALTNGKCLSAEGSKNGSGVLQATMIDLQPCPPMGGRPRHRLQLPFHLPHRHH